MNDESLPEAISNEYAGDVVERKKKEFWHGIRLWLLLNFCVVPLMDFALALGLDAIAPVYRMEDVGRPQLAVLGLMLLLPCVINVGLMIYFAVKGRFQVVLGMIALPAFAIAIFFLIAVSAILMKSMN